ncbi:SMP-30/gluconolactonase/LRE family protein [Frigidibacter sp. ROC022]|uniref:SMP-30/gluconolactonase/LRE family protein n=1 Tax=Frigidibacter sp. ROC022 TaxID=2971796 RepID=UPI00215B43FB|nr:SMP-30/gluconolactonase/LRE family protein [Frigidibacter sp. ROC022]MCR8723504.1 SMP-30/gluconolactonase/LRE family protein [Frigidibacter sp. ROC022]
MPPQSASVTRCLELDLGVGESPVWDDRTGRLVFIDILAPAIFRYDPESGAVERWDMPETIGSCGLCADGRIVAALRSGVFLFDPESGALDLLARPEPDRPGNRLNDGKVGPDGAFWIGSMDDTADKGPNAALYRVTADGAVTKVVEGLTVSNGLAWSADGRRMFHSDSRQTVVWIWDFDPATGAATNRREIRRLPEADGRPDGAAGDAEGCYWSAGVSAGCLNRLAQDGTLLQRVDVPILAPTMPCFAGPDLKTVYLTSLTTRRGDRAEAGGLYRLDGDLGIAGAPVARFG